VSKGYACHQKPPSSRVNKKNDGLLNLHKDVAIWQIQSSKPDYRGHFPEMQTISQRKPRADRRWQIECSQDS
jgi:hypothetical protein